MSKPAQNLIGYKFLKYIVTKPIGKYKSGGVIWECQCECGAIVRKYSGEILGLGKRRSRNCQECSMTQPKSFNSPFWGGFGEISGSYWRRVKNASKRNDKKVLSLTIEDAWELFLKQNRQCALTGVQLEFCEQQGSKTTASLDRIDSSKGYILGNVQWVHKDINKMKQDFSKEYLIDLCKKIVDFHT